MKFTSKKKFSAPVKISIQIFLSHKIKEEYIGSKNTLKIK
jgi:hypothetical protein